MRDLVSEIDLHHHGVLEAHAGTGKTYTIVGLVVRLLAERRLEMRQILLVTYTQKAAGELLERIRKGIEKASATHPDQAVREHLRANLANLHEALVGTIHGVCLRLLRAFPFESGLPFATELVDDEDGVEICLREALRSNDWKGPFVNPGVFAKVVEAKSMDGLFEIATKMGVSLLDASTRLHPPGLDGMDDLSDPARWAAVFVARWAKEGARRWRGNKASAGFLSYQDMLEFMERAMDRSDFLAAMRSQVKIGIVDEFQDTSARQWSIFEKWFLALGPEAGSLYLVGDPKQSIYSFQGADVRTYQRACQALRARAGTRFYQLDTNWRSLPSLIDGYNALFCQGGEAGWFLTENIHYDTANQAKAPTREAAPSQILSDELFRHPVRIARLEGSAFQARDRYARDCAAWILALRGRKVDLPEGASWKSRLLDWNDFAIVASTRSAAKAFYRVLDEQGIPWALYKQQGVFSSRTALEVAAVLRAIHAPLHEVSIRALGLSTRILQNNDETLEVLHELALSRKWARLIRILSSETGAGSRLLGSPQGDRQWMDLRQILEYCLEYLLAGSGGIPELVEHLSRLRDDREQASEDRNLLASATDRGRVQILTMHVSKGLEFPVVFLAGAGRSNKEKVHTWIEDGDDGPSLRLMPALLKEGKDSFGAMVAAGKAMAASRRDQEERRLFYVALTRPKLLMVVPCHVVRNTDGSLSKSMAPLAQAVYPHLDKVGEGVAPLGVPPDPLFPATSALAQRESIPVHSANELQALRLGSRSRVQTSYTQVASVSNIQHGLEGRIRRSEEVDVSGESAVQIAADAWLPRGAKTGDALHEILETWMDPDADNSWLRTDPIPEKEITAVRRMLGLHGLDGDLAPRVASLLICVLRQTLPLPGGASVRLCDLAPEDRHPETEFHWAFGADGRPVASGQLVKGWMVGYIDLLFRVDKKWYVLDWKTTSLDRWDPDELTQSVVSHSYDLQAKLYGRTVASALVGDESFGGGVVLYLRAFANPATAQTGSWTALPGVDSDEIAKRLRAWLHERGHLAGGVGA